MLKKIKGAHYFHKVLAIGWFRFSGYKLGKKFCIRLELSTGW